MRYEFKELINGKKWVRVYPDQDPDSHQIYTVFLDGTEQYPDASQAVKDAAWNELLRRSCIADNKKRLRQVRDALNKCKSPDIIEQIAQYLKTTKEPPSFEGTSKATLTQYELVPPFFLTPAITPANK